MGNIGLKSDSAKSKQESKKKTCWNRLCWGVILLLSNSYVAMGNAFSCEMLETCAAEEKLLCLDKNSEMKMKLHLNHKITFRGIQLISTENGLVFDNCHLSDDKGQLGGKFSFSDEKNSFIAPLVEIQLTLNFLGDEVDYLMLKKEESIFSEEIAFWDESNVNYSGDVSATISEICRIQNSGMYFSVLSQNEELKFSTLGVNF